MTEAARLRGGTLALVLAATSVSALWGLTARDLTGDELALGEHIGGVLAHSYMPSSPDDFSAHLPLFGVIRALFLQALPASAETLARRLPAALLVLAGAALHWWIFARDRRWGAAVVAGLAFGLHPLASFYAHDSSNYALSPLCAGLVLLGLADLRRGRTGGARWLAAGLVLGTFSDFFFAFVVTTAAAATAWIVRRDPGVRGAALTAWGAAIAIQAIPAGVFLWHISRFPASDFMAPHADAAGERVAAGTALLDHAALVVSSYFEGYHQSHEADRVLLAAAAALVALGLGRAWRGGPVARTGALLLLGILAQMLLVGFVFTATTGHFAPLGVRSHMALLAPLVVVWAAAVGEPGRGRGGAVAAVGAAALVLALGARTGWQVTHLAATRQPVAERLVEAWRDGDALVSIFRLHDRLPDGFPGASDVDPCLPAGPPPARLWLVGDPGSTWPDTIAPCDGGAPLLASGWSLTYAEHQPLPFYEWDSGSFLVGTALYRFDRAPRAVEPWPPARLEVRDPPPGRELTARWRVPGAGDDDVAVLPVTSSVSLPPFVDDADALEVAYRGSDGLTRDWLTVAPGGPGGIRITAGPASGPVVWTDAPSWTLSLAPAGRRGLLLARRALAVLAVLCAAAGMAGLGRRE